MGKCPIGCWSQIGQSAGSRNSRQTLLSKSKLMLAQEASRSRDGDGDGVVLAALAALAALALGVGVSSWKPGVVPLCVFVAAE